MTPERLNEMNKMEQTLNLFAKSLKAVADGISENPKLWSQSIMLSNLRHSIEYLDPHVIQEINELVYRRVEEKRDRLQKEFDNF